MIFWPSAHLLAQGMPGPSPNIQKEESNTLPPSWQNTNMDKPYIGGGRSGVLGPYRL